MPLKMAHVQNESEESKQNTVLTTAKRKLPKREFRDETLFSMDFMVASIRTQQKEHSSRPVGLYFARAKA